ncbi:MAG TPA: DUF2079 domain-containing protein [Candidatus Cybelea sp.]
MHSVRSAVSKVGRSRTLWDALVVALFVALAATLCAIVCWRYAIFRNGVDLGIFTQVIAGIGSGFSSAPEGGVNHLLVHWSPIIALGWPFVRAFGPLGLECFAAILVAAVLFPIWGLARARFKAPIAFALVVVGAIYPILWANGVGDFHEMAFVPFLSATFVYALDRRRPALTLVAVLLLLCTKEDQFVVLALNGLLFAATARGDAFGRRTGLLVFGLAVAMSLTYFGPIRHALGAQVPYLSLRFFDWHEAGTATTGLSAAVTAREWYAIVILAPLAFLPCVSRYGLFLIPGFIEVLASHRPITLMPGAHYSALLTGYALAAFVDGAGRLAPRWPRLVEGLIPAAAATGIAIGIFASPMEYWYYLYRRPNAHDALLAATLAHLPPLAQVGAEDEVFAHLGLDPNASIGFAGQNWFVYDQTHYSVRWRDVDEPSVRAAIARRDYRLVSERDGIAVLRKRD